MTVALLALFVALGGTATAAKFLITTSEQIRDGAVHREDIKRNAVDTSRVANGTLLRQDLSGSLRSSIAQAGTQVLEAFRSSGPVNTQSGEPVDIATLRNIPPGAYAIFAKSTLSPTPPPTLIGEGNAINGRCVLDVTGDADTARSLMGGPGASAPATLNMQITRTYSSPGTAKVSCQVNGAESWSAGNTSIMALRVAAPTRQAVDG